MRFSPSTWLKKSRSLSFVFLSLASPVFADVLKYKGTAVRSGGEMAYLEAHEETYDNKGRILKSKTSYSNPKGEPIAELSSEYPLGPRLPHYTFKDFRTGYLDETEVVGQKVIMKKKEDRDSELEEDSLDLKPDHVAGQGFHQWVRTQLLQLAEGEVLPVYLIFPSRFDDFHFRVRKRNLKDQTLQLRLEFDSWFMRLFAPHIDVDYDLKTKRLLRYEGPSNLLTDSGKKQNVVITYDFSKTSVPKKSAH